jgi:hypothetical protein
MKTLTLFLTLGMACAPGATVFNVTGPSNFAEGLSVDQAAAAAFTVSHPFTGLNFFVPLSCFGCTGTAFLTDSLDVGFTGSLLAVSPITVTGALTQVFTGINLPAAGTYFLVISNTSGVLLWNGTSTPTVTGDPAVGRVIDFFASSAIAIAPGSRFDAIIGNALDYTITDSAVPEPATGLLAAAGLCLLVARRAK